MGFLFTKDPNFDDKLDPKIQFDDLSLSSKLDPLVSVYLIVERSIRILKKALLLLKILSQIPGKKALNEVKEIPLSNGISFYEKVLTIN